MAEYTITELVSGETLTASTPDQVRSVLHNLCGTDASVDTLVNRMERGDHYRYLENFLSVRVVPITQ